MQAACGTRSRVLRSFLDDSVLRFSFPSAGPADSLERTLWLRSGHDERDRVLPAVQSVRAPAIALEQRLHAVSDQTRPPLRLREQPEAVWVQAVP